MYGACFVFILFTVIQDRYKVDGLLCLRCSDVTEPRLCDKVEICGTNEICAVQMYRADNGDVGYWTGCLPQMDCTSIDNRTASTNRRSLYIDGEVTCRDCCVNDLCNSYGCGSPTYPSTRGPLCFECRDVRDSHNCHHITPCGPNEKCFIEERSVFGQKYYSSKCESPTACDVHFTGPVVGKKRDIIAPCVHCCEGDLCNRNCSTASEHASQTATVKPTVILYFDCWELYRSGQNKSGVYKIYPWKVAHRPVEVFCDMETDHKGYTVFQRRMDGSVSFDRTFAQYKDGFGNASSEYWIGNDILHNLTSEHDNMLYVKLEHTNGRSYYETYDRFSVSDESDDYRLSISQPAKGTAGDSFIHEYDLNGQTFKTPDHDSSSRRCASSYTRGGWWFKECHDAYLNGVYGSSSWSNPWHTCISSGSYFRSSVMMLTRR